MMQLPLEHPTRIDSVTSSWSPDAYGEGPDVRPAQAAVRPPYRPPIGIPVPRERRWLSTMVSVALHGLVILLIVSPVVVPKVLQEIQGAGGEGPAGGGGGGTMGTGGGSRLGPVIRERLHYVQVAPTPPAPAATQQPVVPPPVVPPKPTPAPVPPPVTPTPPAATPPTPEPAATAPQASASVASAPTPGTGGGTGSDGTAGSGPGSGGGVGTGIGTGRGSGIGPGTGGGNAAVHTPTPIEVPLPPMPVPNRVKGSQVVAVFDVDSTGRVLSFEVEPTRDGGYNRKLRDVLAGVRFRAATTQQGQPIRAKGSITIVF